MITHQHWEVLALLSLPHIFIVQAKEGVPRNQEKQTETKVRFDGLCGSPWHNLSVVGWLAVPLHIPASSTWALLQFRGLIISLWAWECIQIWKANKSFRLLTHAKKIWEQKFPHALGWNQPGQTCGQGEYKLKTLWFSCLMLTVQLVSRLSSFLLCPCVCSETGCWLHSLPSSNSSTLLRKQEETRAWITTWVTNSQHLVLLRARGENSFPLCDSPSPVTLQMRLQTPLLFFQNCSPSCAAMLANSTWRGGETTSHWALWQCFAHRPLMGYDVSTPQNTGAPSLYVQIFALSSLWVTHTELKCLQQFLWIGVTFYWSSTHLPPSWLTRKGRADASTTTKKIYNKRSKSCWFCWFVTFAFTVNFPIKYNCLLGIVASSWNVFASSP